MKPIDKTLYDALIKNNVLNEEDLLSYIEESTSANEPLHQFLLDRSTITEKQLLISLSQHLGLDTVHLTDNNIDPKVVERIPVKFAWYYKFMPFKIEGRILSVAAYLPIDIRVIDEIRNFLQLEVKVFLSSRTEVMDMIKKYYGFASDTIDRIMTKEPSYQDRVSADDGKWVEDLEKSTDDPTVSHLVNQIILEAYKKRATDIHIEPYRNRVRFRYRIDGVLVDANLPENVKHFLSPILSRIKILANLSITEKRLPQDGSAVVRTKDQNLDLRISTMPTPRGESMVIRILPTKVMLFSLEKLGFSKECVLEFEKLINKPHGIIFITGPTGSGKTTTLYACLNEISSPTRKIITIEDPVEYEMEGITQVQVNSKVQFTFATGLRSLLRHDPDIIMVGEVRDLETAEMAIRTALTGHLVFSTLHTNDAASGITRLVDMGVEPYLVASSVEAFVAQRLVRVICPKCKIVDDQPIAGITEEIKRSLRLSDDIPITIYKGEGCEYCSQTGYYGRIAIYEILHMNDMIRAAILEKPRSDYIKKIARQEGLITLRQNGWQAVLNGFTTPYEVMNVSVRDEEIDLGGKPVPISLTPVKSFKPSEKTDPDVEPLTEGESREDGQFPSKDEDKTARPLAFESRIYPRLETNLSFQWRSFTAEDNQSELKAAQMLDLSAGGVRFVAKENLSVGSLLDVELPLLETHQHLTCRVKVCRTMPYGQDNQSFLISAYYLNLSHSDRGIISKFVNKMLQDANQEAVQSEKR
ncbi:MAG: Flp pilus assembly complex ATPase component TadA [Candidatus Omnitrophica bacterium]|nr:Flp pilus assembly complex ATPase component TadA [Candidatus Omnitrophota bacterium]